MLHLVAPFLRNEGRVLLVRRDSPPHEGRWDVPSDAVRDHSGATLALAREAAARATTGDPVLDCAGESFAVAGVDRSLTVHPYLFATPTRAPGERADRDRAWVHPPAVRERETVPWLAEAYDRVAPDLATVREDRDHGSAWVAARALELLRDRAATADDLAPVAALARDLRDARPAMAVVANRVNRAMAGAETPADVRLSGPVATCSRSETVLAALAEVAVPVVVGESRLGCEGVATAEALGARATLVPDAVLPGTLAGLSGRPATESVLLGADAVLPDGSVVNRTGSYPLALAAEREDRPVRVVATRDKVRAEGGFDATEREPSTALYDGDDPVATATPLFERVPARLVDAVVTEDGVLDADDVAAVATDHREAARWDEDEGET